MPVMPGDSMSGTFAYDMSAIDRLKYSSKKSSKAGVAAAAKQFEAMFLKEILSSMRKAMPKSTLLGDSNAQKQYQDMLDTQWSQDLAEHGGIGLAKMIEKRLDREHAGKSTNVGAAAAASAGQPVSHAYPKAHPQALKPSESLAAIRAQRAAAGPSRDNNEPSQAKNQASPIAAAKNAGPVVDLAAGAATPLLSFDPTVDGAAASAKVRDFVDQLSEPARRAADRTGISSRLILAQAALETGWGKHEIKTDSGQPSFNVFNIKATGWQGASTDVATHEYRDGVRQATTAGFRVYDSYDQAFDDYARLIDSSPHYAGVREATTPAAAARALQKGGYATDPNYANKLVSVMQAIPESTGAGGLFAKGGDTPIVNLSDRDSQPLV